MNVSVVEAGPEAAPGQQGPERAVNRYYALVDAGRLKELMGLFAPDARYDRPGFERLVGREALADFYTSRRPIAHGRHRLFRVLVDGRNVAAEGTFEGVLRNGEEVSLRFSDFFTVDTDGLFSSRVTYYFSALV